MKNSRPIFIVLLLLVLATCKSLAKPSRQDSILLERIFSFQRNYTHEVRGFATNVYVKHLYQTHQRNFTLWAIPTTYAIAKGQRTFVSEQYSRLYFRSIKDFENIRQVYYTTIPRNRRTLSILSELITPNLYETTLYGDHILSPFSRDNKRHYVYSSAYLGNGKVRLYFRPRVVPNTQLVRGKAIVNRSTGQVEQLEMEGEFDMIRFRTLTMQGDYGVRALLPKLCKTSIEFKFAGNHVTSDFTALFDCPITLPDTIDVKGDRQLIDSIRPISLSEEESAVYHIYDSLHAEPADTIAADTLMADSLYPTLASVMPQFTQASMPFDTLSTQAIEEEENKHEHHDLWKEIGWDIIGSNLIHSLETENERGSIELSPLLNPQYISYSREKGVTYKMKLWGEYHFSPTTWLKTRPRGGYRFRLHDFYFDIPIWLYYTPKSNGVWYLNISKSNRIGSSDVLNDIVAKTGESIETVDNREWHYFNDLMYQLSHSIQVTPWLTVASGLTFHHRKGIHDNTLRRLGLTSVFKSLAPAVSINWRPWAKAPMFTIDYERAFKFGPLNIDYERWEGDVAVKRRLPSMQTINMRAGAGIYTRKGKNHFLDFSNFRDNNLPEGWDDDWSGDFQLLDSRLYNESRYYIRGNISYESPLLCTFLIPGVGRYIERERFYWNGLSIQNTRFYSELGYGFTTRYFSVGLFTSFLNVKYQEMTAKFTFELFRRW